MARSPWRLTAVLVMVSAGCQSAGEKALTDFRKFVDATYTQERRGKMECKLSGVDVIKTDSVSSPFMGKMHVRGSIQLDDILLADENDLVFRRDGDQWVCDSEKSKGYNSGGVRIDGARACKIQMCERSYKEPPADPSPEWLKKKQ
jgi:hypothetical protein